MFKLNEILEKFKKPAPITGVAGENKGSVQEVEGQVSIKQVRNWYEERFEKYYSSKKFIIRLASDSFVFVNRFCSCSGVCSKY
jgi:hypothetical protein